MVNNQLLAQIDIHDQKQVEKVARELLVKMEREKKTLQEALEISDAFLERFYSIAYGFYNQGKYKESLGFFQLLTTMAPKNYKFAFGLGASFFQQQDYMNASLAFMVALYLAPDYPLSAYYASECFLKREEDEAALECLDMAIAACSKNEEYSSLKERCLLIKKSIKSKK